MKEQITQRAKSKTYWLGMAVMFLSYAQTNIGQIEQFLGGYEGAVTFVIGGLIMFMREVTTKPLSGKNAPKA